jgi:arylsulfatase A-like enzyme
MKRSDFLIPSFLILMLFGFNSCTEKGRTDGNKQQPNFVFFLVDDLGWTDLGCYGSTFYETPNIDQLAAEGMRFTDAYAACPVCSPTRASIMTGKYPARINLTDWIPGRQFYTGPQACDKLIPQPFAQQMEMEEVTIAEALKRAGYQTFFAGKWHLGEDSLYWPENQGFDANFGGWGKGWPKGGYFSPYENPRLQDGPEGEHLTDRITSESIRFLEEVRDRPFFLYLSFYAVHTPLQAKERLREKYKGKADSLGLTDKQQLAMEKEWIKKAPPKGEFVERIIQAHPVYGGMVETLDRNIGRIMEKLESLGLEENTIVIFTSDNGGLSTAEGSPTSNLPLRAGKGWLYEGGIREPAIIKWPGKTLPGSVSNLPVTSTDYYPTILEMAGLSLMPEQHVDGKSLVPLIQNETKWPERPLFWHYPHYSNQGGKPGAAVRLGPYKLIEFFEEGNFELYDLAADIGESKDLSDSMPEKAAELKKLLKEWQKEVDAGMMDPNPGFEEDYERVIE